MDRFIYTAMTGAKHAFLRQAGVANNLANASTVGYRSQDHQFRAVPIQGEGLATRAFVVDASVKDVLDQGTLSYTGRALDVAVQGQGWIAAQAPNGQEVYTRAGNLQISANGQLQTAEGYPVLSSSGPIAVPPDNRVTIAPDGTVSVIPQFGTPNVTDSVGQLKLVNPDPATLERGADGFFRQKNGQPADVDPTVRLAPETLEGSNVNVVDSMVTMISLSRQFEMQIQMMQKADTNARSADQLLAFAN